MNVPRAKCNDCGYMMPVGNPKAFRRQEGRMALRAGCFKFCIMCGTLHEGASSPTFVDATPAEGPAT